MSFTQSSPPPETATAHRGCTWLRGVLQSRRWLGLLTLALGLSSALAYPHRDSGGTPARKAERINAKPHADRLRQRQLGQEPQRLRAGLHPHHAADSQSLQQTQATSAEPLRW